MSSCHCFVHICRRLIYEKCQALFQGLSYKIDVNAEIRPNDDKTGIPRKTADEEAMISIVADECKSCLRDLQMADTGEKLEFLRMTIL